MSMKQVVDSLPQCSRIVCVTTDQTTRVVLLLGLLYCGKVLGLRGLKHGPICRRILLVSRHVLPDNTVTEFRVRRAGVRWLVTGFRNKRRMSVEIQEGQKE